MKYAADFRAIARNALRGKWRVAVLTGFIAFLIGAETLSGGGATSTNISYKNFMMNLQDSEFWTQLRVYVIITFVVLIVWLIISILMGGAGTLGYAKFNLNLVDKKEESFFDLFSQFDRIGTGICMKFLVSLYTILWTLLFIVPGIIKGYSYAMTPYILAEHPEMTVSEAITESRRIMDGNKWRLCCLAMSFLGWATLCMIPPNIATFILAGISMRTQTFTAILFAIPLSVILSGGLLFLRPYQEAAYAAFYREISGTENIAPLIQEKLTMPIESAATGDQFYAKVY